MYRVMIVEDDPMAQQLLGIYIKNSPNYTLACCIESAAMAEVHCLSEKIDLILMDVCTAMNANGIDAAAEIKKHIIQNSIYGVDIEKGAVDIARLRFWLSIIVDEKTPHALPNMDFKIMQGNSLIESFEGVDLSKLKYEKEHKKDSGDILLFDNENNRLKKTVSYLLTSYFSCCDHQRKQELQKD